MCPCEMPDVNKSHFAKKKEKGEKEKSLVPSGQFTQRGKGLEGEAKEESLPEAGGMQALAWWKSLAFACFGSSGQSLQNLRQGRVSVGRV